MPDYMSHAGQLMDQMRQIVAGLQPPDMDYAEVQVRDNWLSNTGDPYRGASIVYGGEQYSDGTVGTQDIGHIFNIVFAKFRSGDSLMADDKLIQWYEQVRRRCADQRILATLGDATAPKEHVMIVMPGRPLTDGKKWPNYLIRQLVVVAWHREVNTSY